MSGTSLDGVDAVVADLDGSGRGMTIAVRGQAFVPYPEELRRLVFAASRPDTSDVRTLCLLDARLPRAYAEAVRAACKDAGIEASALDAVGCHGQTVWHAPEPEDVAGEAVAATLQIGDPATLAKLLGVPVVGDFRTGDVALGGQGAPLVPYFDYVRFASDDETRLLLNLGGIANVTVLPRGGGVETVFAFDTGPANMIADRLVQRFFGLPYDEGGALAQEGAVDEALLARLLDDDYLRREPPKSTGREKYDEAFVDALVAGYGLPNGPAADADRPRALSLVATAAAFTAASVHDAYTRFIAAAHPADTLIVSGGGRHNAAIMDGLRRRFKGVNVRTTDDYGVDGDVKEALLMAVLAHECLNEAPTNLPRVTGARAPTVLGKICL
jgi:anhydro-N-acetylmuramic acid kinase